MIVQAIKKQTVDVEINPVDVVNDIFETWKMTWCRLPRDADLIINDEGSRWFTYERQGHTSESVFKRDATNREVEQYLAFEQVLEIVRDFE